MAKKEKDAPAAKAAPKPGAPNDALLLYRAVRLRQKQRAERKAAEILAAAPKEPPKEPPAGPPPPGEGGEG